MDVKLVSRDDTGELIMTGKLESSTAKEAQDLFLATGDRFTNVILNMKDLSYISSAGLRAIKKLYIKLKAKGGEITILNANQGIKDVFDMTGISGLLNIE